MIERTWIDYVTAIGSVATPVFVIILTAVGWRLRRGIERRLELEDKLRENRIATYNEILEPFIILLTSDAAWQHDKKHSGIDKGEVALSKLLSLEYRRQGFKLSLVGSDAVVSAYNNLMQFFYSRGDSPASSQEDLKQMMGLLGTFLLEIRRSMGNEATKLDKWEMLEWFMSDVRSIKNA